MRRFLSFSFVHFVSVCVGQGKKSTGINLYFYASVLLLSERAKLHFSAVGVKLRPLSLCSPAFPFTMPKKLASVPLQKRFIILLSIWPRSPVLFSCYCFPSH